LFDLITLEPKNRFILLNLQTITLEPKNKYVLLDYIRTKLKSKFRHQ
jgi:hypothetical protein